MPYAPGSTPNISASSSNGQTGTVEGWRAVLTVVLRYGMGRRQQISLGNAVERQAREEGHSPSWTEPIDNVKSMVVGVKSRGVSASYTRSICDLKPHTYARAKSY